MLDKPRIEIRTNIKLCISSEHLDKDKLKEWLDGQINTMLAEIEQRARVDFVRWE